MCKQDVYILTKIVSLLKNGPAGHKMRTPSKWLATYTIAVCFAAYVSVSFYLSNNVIKQPFVHPRKEEERWSGEIPPKVIIAKAKLTESPDNVFFIETSCAKNQNDVTRQGLILKPRQACAIYSAAYHNPNKRVYLIFTCPLLNNFYSESPNVTRALLELPNFFIAEVNLTNIYARSPLQKFLGGLLKKSKYPVEHNADILRVLIVYLFGGTYMDLDVISIRPLDDLKSNYIGAQDSFQLGTGVFHFDARHPYLKEILLEAWGAYNPDAWAAVGPVLATSVLRKVCNITETCNLETVGYLPHCSIRVWGYKVFYPIRYPEWQLYWKDDGWPLVESMLNETYVVHVWNYMSGGAAITVGSEQPYAKLAEQNCAPVYSRSGKVF